MSRIIKCVMVASAAALVTTSAMADQQILDDLIVDGSACIGQDCVNGEAFGFDTLRLKENNLRVKFQDTSTSASFPSNDWELTANDSSNGGLNHFSITDISGGRIPFRVEAGAPSNSLYVDDGGRIGFGTSTPVAELHVKDGDTPTLRLEQDGSSGFTPQTWDVAGNEANFFIRDATNGSTLPFKIRPGNPNNLIVLQGGTSDRIDLGGENANASLTVLPGGGSVGGNVGIGTQAPSRELHVSRSNAAATVFLLENTNAAPQAVQVRLKSDSDNNRRIMGRNASDAAESQIVLGDDGAFKFFGETEGGTNSGVCLRFRDSDDGGNTACTFLDGAINCVIGDC